MKNKMLAALIVGALSMGILTACGSAATGEVTDTTTESTTESTTDAADDVVASQPEGAIDEAASVSAAIGDGVLTVGTNAEFPPFEYVDDNGEPDGFDMALIRAIGEKMGVEVVIENMEFDSLVASIGNKIDVAIAGMTITEERKLSVDFSNPYYEAVQYVILPKESAIQTAADLEGKAIGVQLGTTGDFIVEDDIKDATASQYKKGVDAVNDLINGRVDCVIIDKNPALVFASKFEDKLIAVDGAQFEFGAEEYAIAMPKGDPVLTEQINKALEEVKADGTFDELVKTYIEAQ